MKVTDPAEFKIIAGFTNQGVLVGSERYASPELAKGESISEKSDVWAIGMSALEMATGKGPWHKFGNSDS